MNLKEEMRRRKYVKAMLKAIDLCRTNDGFVAKQMSKTAGLRTIREFEEINKIKFDPFNELHLNVISGMARFGELLRLSRIELSK